MDEAFRRAARAAWEAIPEDLRRAPATEAELRAFEAEFDPIPPDFRWFLSACGGGPVGSEWVDGIADLAETHRRFREQCEAGFWPGLAEVFVIGWDGCGNPYGVHGPSGRVVVEDHDFGGVHEMAGSFVAFLRAGLGPS